MNRISARIAAVALCTGGALLLATGPASAHVTARVIGESAVQGGYTKITFRVPNEDEEAGTVKVEIKLPEDTPITSLRTKALPGWTAKVVKSKLKTPVTVHGNEITEAITSISWTANPGVRIAPGEFAEFEVSGGPMPETEQLVLPAVQTYEGGKVVNWDAPPTDGAEPERPAPVVKLAPKSEGDDHHGGGTTPADDTHAEAAGPAEDTTARWLGGAGLAVGALGLGIGAGATLRARKLSAKG
ncbi:YcnI family protein [Actinokineospora soli]|uniref:YcnI family protein n=1 Tax=Actinokineospora soli TaxID=1048753 RepID=A0ABW2TZW7_9PSEU